MKNNKNNGIKININYKSNFAKINKNQKVQKNKLKNKYLNPKYKNCERKYYLNNNNYKQLRRLFKTKIKQNFKKG